MGSSFEDREHTAFIAGDDTFPTLSLAALMLHSSAILQTVNADTPGLVDDVYLGAIRAETDLTATELVMSGLWERVEGGYRILDPAAIEKVVEMTAPMRAGAAVCAVEGHVVDASMDGFCPRCSAPIEEP